MREWPMGIKSSELVNQITVKIGFQLDMRSFGCSSLLEFLRKFIMPTMDVEIITTSPYDSSNYLIRSKEFLRHYGQQQEFH